MWRQILMLVGACALLGCQERAANSGGDPNNGSRKPVTHIDNRLIEADNRFGFELLSELTRPDPTQNVFISPASVALALTMTYNGAAGETQTAMADVLGLSGMSRDEVNAANAKLLALLTDPDPKVRLEVANSLWARAGVAFDSAFLARNREFFAAEIRALDFSKPEAATTINGWVSEKTAKRIETIVDPPIDPLTVLFLINAIYFKGTWTYEFDRAKTRSAVFHFADGREGTLPFMTQERKYRYLRRDGFQAVCLPYGSKRWGMYVFLPDPEVGLEGFLGELDSDHWTEWMSGFQEQEGKIALPRFRLEYEESLKRALAALGMDIAFTDYADFSAMTPPPHLPLAITEVKHKTFLEVNEEGTEAAAATSVEVGVTSFGPFVMRVDRPFFCAIRDDSTGVVLFMGAVNEPK